MVILKKSFVFIIIIILLLSCSMFLKNKYNTSVVEYDLETSMDYKFLSIDLPEYVTLFELVYSKSYMNFELLMITGRSEAFRNEKIDNGQNLSKVDSKGIVLGDEVAGYYFNRSDVVGEILELFGTKYKVVGIKSNSNEIIIPFTQSIINNNWSKMKLLVQFDNMTDIYAKAQNIDYLIRENGSASRFYVVNYDDAYFFMNVIIVIVLLWFYQILSYLYFMFIKNFKAMYSSIMKFHHRKTILDIVKEKSREFMIIMLSFITSIIVLVIMYKISLNIKIPQMMIPSNFLSLRSWIDVLLNIIDRILINFKYGFSDMSRDFILLCFISLFSFMSLDRFYETRIEPLNISAIFRKNMENEV